MEDLRDVVRAIERAAGNKGGHWFEREAHALGHERFSYQTIDKILKGQGSNPRKFTLEAMAAVAERYGVDPDRVWAAAKKPMPTIAFAEELPLGVDELDRATRDALLEIIRALLRNQSGEVRRDRQPSPQDSPTDLRLVARKRGKGTRHADGGASDD